jgi:hypothetical protein
MREELDETLRGFTVQELYGQLPWQQNPKTALRADRIIAKDRSLLAIIEWDTNFTLIAGKFARLQSIALHELFDGFAVTPATCMDWWNDEPSQGASAVAGM